MALAILGVALVAVLQVSVQAINAHVYAKKLTVATLLARSKLVDLEQELLDKPLPADDTEESGDFSDEGWSRFKWRAKIVVPKTNGLTPEQLFGALFNLPLGGGAGAGAGAGGDPAGFLGALFGASGQGGSAGSAGGAPGSGGDATGGLLAAMGPMAGIAGAQFGQMVQLLQQSVREVHLTVSWKEGNLTESVDLVTHVVTLGPGSDRNGASGAPGAGGAGWVRSDTGAPVANPQKAPSGGGMVDPADGSPLITVDQWRAANPGAPPVGGPGVPGLLPGGAFRPGGAQFR